MKKQILKKLCISLGLMLAFTVWTVAICKVDLQPIGPRDSVVGFASMNGFFHSLTGTSMLLYTITDWLGLVPLGVCIMLGVLGFIQMVRRKSILKVDGDILALGVFYIVVITFYILFEAVAINYRPVLINGFLEASYPSSTTLLTLCVMPTAILQVRHRVKSSVCNRAICMVIGVLTAFMVIGRLVSGVHWLTDIIGSVLLSGGLVMTYVAVCCLFHSKNKNA